LAMLIFAPPKVPVIVEPSRPVVGIEPPGE
jgi:hypothetical protein